MRSSRAEEILTSSSELLSEVPGKIKGSNFSSLGSKESRRSPKSALLTDYRSEVIVERSFSKDDASKSILMLD